MGYNMAYKFVEKRKTTQEEIAYIAYMIIASYFHKTKCRNQNMADRLYLFYAEMKEAKQESKEQQIIAQAELLLKESKEVLSLMNCEVLISFRDHKYILDFITGFEQICVEVDSQGECKMQMFLSEENDR